MSSSPEKVVAIVRHGKSDADGHLTIDVAATVAHMVVNLQMRGATPEEI